MILHEKGKKKKQVENGIKFVHSRDSFSFKIIFRTE